jgi:hypothetical protein
VDVKPALFAAAVLVFAGCSGKARVVALDGSAGDVSENGTDADWLCPGHVDPGCTALSCYPSFTINTSDGSPSIISARVASEACILDPAAFPDGGVEALATVLVYGSGYSCPTSPCVVQVTLKDGRTVEVMAESQQGITMPYRRCLRNTNCCDRSEYIEGTSTSCYWSPGQVEVEVVTMGGDGGAMD